MMCSSFFLLREIMSFFACICYKSLLFIFLFWKSNELRHVWSNVYLTIVSNAFLFLASAYYAGQENVFLVYFLSCVLRCLNSLYQKNYILRRTRKPLQTSWGKFLRYRGRMGLTMLFWGTDDWIPGHLLFIAAAIQPHKKKR